MNAVDKKLRDLLTELMNIEFLDEFYLAGGTNLALRENHRISVDLDLFVYRDFSIEQSNFLNIKLKNTFGSRYQNIQVSEVGVFGSIDNIKVDFVNFPYPLLEPIDSINDFRMASKIDIAAMKINDIVGRGSKNDFYDIDKLLEFFSMKEMLLAYKTKFKVDTLAFAKKSLVYFMDANNTLLVNNHVVSLEKKSWEQIQATITKAIKNLEK
jgi:predicted nucleotidyltransferase component of viral defense system